MNPASDPRLRRATTHDVHRVLLATPAARWHAEDLPQTALHYTLDSYIDTVSVLAHARFPRARPRRAPAAPQCSRLIVTEAAPFRRLDWSSTGVGEPDTALISHPRRGVLYLDRRTQTFIQRDPVQLLVAESARGPATGKLEWQIRPGEARLDATGRTIRSYTIRLEQRLCVEWTVDALEDAALTPYALSVYEHVLGDLPSLRAYGMPLEKIAAWGLPLRTRTVVYKTAADCPEEVGVHVVGDPGVIVPNPGDFVPGGFVPSPGLKGQSDRRRQAAERAASTTQRTRRAQEPRGPDGESPRTTPEPAPAPAPARRAYAAAPAMHQAIPSFVVPHQNPDGTFDLGALPVDLPVPSCVPSTYRATAATDLRQLILDHVQFLLNQVATRLSEISGTRHDTDTTDVSVTLDWLDQFSHANDVAVADTGEPDHLFCLLRDPPPADDITLGGRGLLDRQAAALASTLLAGDNPLPLGGADDPLTLPSDVQDELAAVVADAGVDAESRFSQLSSVAQATVREAVLRERIGRIAMSFEGDSGVLKLPDADHDLLHATLQMEDFTIMFTGNNLISHLAFDGSSIALTVELGGLSASFSHTRSVGDDFWLTAAGVLVVGGLVSAIAIGPLIVLLVGLGPAGLALLDMMVSWLAIPAALVLLSVALFVLWDDAAIDVAIDAFSFTANLPLHLEADRLAFTTRDVTLVGPAVRVHYDSQLPTGIHQVLGWLSESVINIFDGAREQMRQTLEKHLAAFVRSLPHLVAPLPARIKNDDAVLLQHVVRGIALDIAEEGRVAYEALTEMQLRPLNAGSLLTQTQTNTMPLLRDFLATLDQGITKLYGGYALSQNLLNAVAHAAWSHGVFALDLSAAEEQAWAAILAARGLVVDDGPARTAHAWAASPPRIFVTPYAYAKDARHPVLLAVFDDVRVCFGLGDKEASSLEVKWGAQTIAHAGFGHAAGRGDPLSLITTDTRFLNVYYESCPDALTLQPPNTREITAAGAPFAAVAAWTDAERVAALDAMAGVMHTAASRVLGTMSAAQIPFAARDTNLDLHLYDAVVRATFKPEGTTLLAAFTLSGLLTTLLPDKTGHVLSTLSEYTCAELLQMLDDQS